MLNSRKLVFTFLAVLSGSYAIAWDLEGVKKMALSCQAYLGPALSPKTVESTLESTLEGIWGQGFSSEAITKTEDQLVAEIKAMTSIKIDSADFQSLPGQEQVKFKNFLREGFSSRLVTLASWKRSEKVENAVAEGLIRFYQLNRVEGRRASEALFNPTFDLASLCSPQFALSTRKIAYYGLIESGLNSQMLLPELVLPFDPNVDVNTLIRSALNPEITRPRRI